MQASSGRPEYPSTSYPSTNHIDLTGDDDDGDYSSSCDRKPKRTCSASRSFNAHCDNPTAPSPARFSYPSGLSPAMSSSSLQPDNRPSNGTTYTPSYSAHSPTSYNGDMHNAHIPPIPAFSGPSNPSAFFNGSSASAVPSALAPVAHSSDGPSMMRPPPQPQQSQQQYAQHSPNEYSRQVIDLTGASPSPPPPPPIQRPPPQVMQGSLPPELPPKTPVCIGQLPATALVLYPVGYLLPQPGMTPETEWVSVRLSYEHNAQAKPGCTETIHIRAPNQTGPTGEVVYGENFAVVEQKAATVLGPMLGKGLIRLDGKVRRGQPNLPIIPLTLLVYTPKGNISVVANYLHQNGLFLDHPSFASDIQRIRTQYYYNPHNPPPGGHRSALSSNARPGYMGPGGGNIPRWNTVSGKSVEVQRSQVDELFKSLRDGEELVETEPAPEIATKLYPHQMKALTFMLDREREQIAFGNSFSSLWQPRHNPLTGQTSWYHSVTQREVFEEPLEAKGSILADDMGLGKTISCVALIAATLESAQAFAATPLEIPSPPPRSNSAEPGLQASHFAGSVWGIPQGGPPEPTSAKGKAKAARELDKMEAEYVRACRIKTRSRATLIVCPLSTVVNWEEQFREHWRGEVVVVGGAGGTCAPVALPPTTQPSPSPWSTPTSIQADVKPIVKSIAGRVREGRALRVYVYHGNSRRPDPTFLADFDAVITTYSTLAVEFSKQSKSLAGADEEEEEEDGNSSDGCVETDDRGNPVIKLPRQKKMGKKRKKNINANTGAEVSSPLQSVNWFRIVLDEAHSIKEITTVACRACCDLLADRRLCLTGTPVQNKLDDVYALLKFLRLEPLDDKSVWTEFIGTPVKYGQPLGVARLQTIMKVITLRRTKESKAENGQKILTLPPRRDELRYLKFDEQEQALYDQFFTESKAEFNELSNKNEVMKNYVGILQKILRLRQICDHFELVMTKGSGDGQSQDTPNYDELAKIIARDGINMARAVAIFSLLKEAGTAQCVECGYELGVPTDNAEGGDACGGCEPDGASKRGRKPKAAASRSSTRQNSPSAGAIHAILTRCQHLFCVGCFRNSCFPGWPTACQSTPHACAVCQTALMPTDAVDMSPDAVPADVSVKKKPGKREKRQKGANLDAFHPSTKIRALLTDLVQFSRANPHSANYDPASIEVQMVDNQGNNLDDGVTKTVVFSQWTSMLDKIEDALEAERIRYDRLDGTMKRDDRTRAMEALKHDPGCEVLLVSLKAGGVGLNLTAAQRVYLMDPYWNPAVENQAVDRIHRLGQTRPVTTVKLIIENSIEDRLLEVQKKKTELANMTLGQNYTKAELLQRRMEELNQLFKG